MSASFSPQRLWRSLFRGPSRKPIRTRKRVPTASDKQNLGLERLEDRTLPAVTYAFDAILGGNVVTFTEDKNGNKDSLVLHISATGDLEYKLNSTTFSTDLKSTVSGIQSLSMSSVKKIVVSLGNGGDSASVDKSGGPITAAGVFNGGTGEDFFDATGFSGPVTLLGGNGKDSLYGGTGNDYIDAGNGVDSISGGPGINTIIGGAGNDVLNESGNYNFAITNSAAKVPASGYQVVDFVPQSDIEQANLTGLSGDNAFSVAGYNGLAKIEGGGGSNSVKWAGSSSFSPDGKVLTVAGGGVFTLYNINDVKPEGSDGDDNLDLSSFSGDIDVGNLGIGDDVVIGGLGHNVFKKKHEDHGKKTFVAKGLSNKFDLAPGSDIVLDLTATTPDQVDVTFQNMVVESTEGSSGIAVDLSSYETQITSYTTKDGSGNAVGDTLQFVGGLPGSFTGSSLDDSISSSGDLATKTIDSGAGNDSISIDAANGDGISIDAGLGSDSISIDVANGDGISIATGDGADSISIGVADGDSLSIDAGVGSFGDSISIDVANGDSLSIATGDGADSISIGVADGDSLSIDAGAGIFNDSISIGEANGDGISISTGDGADSISIGVADGDGISIDAGLGIFNDSISIDIANGDGISISTGEGSDSISIGAADGDGLTIDTGAGSFNDSISIDAANGDSLSIASGDGRDSISIGVADGDGISIDAGLGSDSISIDAANGDGISIDAGFGNDSISIDAANGDGISIATGDGSDSISIGIADGDGLTIDTGSGLFNDSISIDVANGDSLSISAGDGSDSISIGVADGDGISIDAGFGSDSISIGVADGDGISIDAGLGSDSISIGEANGDGLSIDTGAGDDKVFIRDANGDGISISTGDGADSISISEANGDSLSIGDSNLDALSIDTAGGNDSISIGEANLDSMSISTGDGNDSITIGEANNDSISINDADSDSITIDAGFGQDSISISEANNDSISINAGPDNDSISIGEANSDGISIDAGLGADSVSIGEANGDGLSINTGDGADSVSIGEANGDGLSIDTGAMGDTILVSGGTGSLDLTGGAGSDTYRFSGNLQADVSVNEASAVDTDTLDFSGLAVGSGITVSLSSTDSQTLASGLSLTLSTADGIENVIGTAFDDVIAGNSRDNVLRGSSPLDDRYDANAPAPGANGRQQVVWLHFTSDPLLFNTTTRAKGTPEREYTPEEQQAILEGIQANYAAFGNSFYFTLSQTDAATQAGANGYATIHLNEAPPDETGFFTGGEASDLDNRNVSNTGDAYVQLHGTLGEFLMPDDVSENWVALSIKIGSHELGHDLGLRHPDSFGAIGNGIKVLPNNRNYAPVYPGPYNATETQNHIMSSGDSVGTNRFNDLRGLFFGEREDIKLAYVSTASLTPAAGSLLDAEAGGSSFASPQQVSLASLNVPNTLKYGQNAGKTFNVAAVSVTGRIDLDASGHSESDFFSFAGRAGDLINLEVLSRGITRLNAGGLADIGNNIDPTVRLYGPDGNLVNYYGTPAYNDDMFETADSQLLDLYLPADGTYTIQVTPFAYTPGNPNNPNPDNFADPVQKQNIIHALNNTDVGNYEIFLTRFQAGNAYDGNDTFSTGGGADLVYGGKGNDYLTVDAGTAQFDGGGGVNTLAGPNQANSWVLTANNAGTLNGVGFSNVQVIAGGNQNDSMAGPNTASSWSLSDNNAGGLNGVLSFSSIEAINGGSSTDTINGPNSANAWTLSGNNAGDLNGALSFSSVETINGGSDTDTVNGPNSVNTWTLSGNNAGSLNGALSFSSIEAITGGSLGDKLIGPNSANTWNVAGSDAGTLNGDLAFTNMESLTGGSNDDNIIFADGATLSGKVSGAAGTDTLDFSAYTTPISGNLQTGATTGIFGGASGGAALIEIGISGSGNDTLTGGNGNTNWVIDRLNGGTAGSFIFRNFENLLGGTTTGADTFTVMAGGSLTSIDGRGGNDTLNVAGDVTLTGSSANGYAGTNSALGFAGIDVLNGSGKLTGENVASTWTLGATLTYNDGTPGRNLTTSGYSTLHGGSGDDRFVAVPGATVSAVIDGGLGSNTIDYSQFGSAVVVNLATGSATNVTTLLVNIQNVTGGTGSDTITGNSLANIILGGDGNDTVAAGAGNDFVDGGDGNDSLSSTNGSDILVGGAGNDTLTGSNGIDVLIGGLGADSIVGNNGKDILIAGITDYDADKTALDAIMAEWASGGTVSMLTALTVHRGDNSANSLFGGNGVDWFFCLAAEAKDKEGNDKITVIA